MDRSKWSLAGAAVGVWLGVAGLMAACLGACFGVPCVSTGLRNGAWIDTCPVGTPRLTVSAQLLDALRGGEGRLVVDVDARYVTSADGDAPVHQMDLYRGVDVAVRLVDADGEEVDGLVLGKLERRRYVRSAPIALPELPDGDYALLVEASGLGSTATARVELPLYAPAVAHLMTDRPLYKPGQTVLLRSILLKRTDLTPLDGRPGKWRILDPNGDEMLVERDAAGAFGVADTTFPLDRYAAEGTWTARWESGGASDEVQFDVRPFRLPRLSVSLTPSARWYGVGEAVRLDGVATYTSGAPVADAPVVVRLVDGTGRWPIPLEWEAPVSARTDAWGRFTVAFGEVPADLVDRDTLRAVVRVTEAAGEVASASASVIVSADDLKVDAVTELGDGLVGGFNNRAYLRVATPDDRPLPGATVRVENPWDPAQPAREAVADADGVVALQLDPGDPVTVVTPPAPVRVRPLTPGEPSLSRAEELLTGATLGLAERRALDPAIAALRACGDFAPGGASVTTAARVSAGGAVSQVRAEDSALGRCVADAVRRTSWPAGEERTVHLAWSVPDSLRPSLTPSVRAVFGTEEPVRAALAEAALTARRCLDLGRGVSGEVVIRAHWSVAEEEEALSLTSAAARGGHGLSAWELACVEGALRGVRLARPAARDDLGTATLTLSVPSAPSARTARATTTTGYELAVIAAQDGAEVGRTRLTLPVGAVPTLRLRATPTLARAGEAVQIEVLRGPDWSGTLPREVVLYEGSLEVDRAELDPDTRTATFQLPEGVDGFLHVDVGGARAVVFVAPAGPLEVALSTDAAAYRPGERATLTVRTTAGGVGQAAGVGLVGVDQSLSQLAPLLGPDELGRVTVRASSDRPAFDAFDARALALGQVRGEHAALAAVLRISSVPTDPAGDERLYASATSTDDAEAALLTGFYRTYEALVPLVRAWEAEAPAGEVMDPARMVALWDAALDVVEAAGTPPVDGYGRRLRLPVLPGDLLRQVDPRQVVADGTRLPEDVVDWERFVAREVR